MTQPRRKRPLVKRLRRRATVFVASRLGPPLLRALAATWRVRKLGAERSMDSDRRLVFALWHDTIPTGIGLHVGRPLTVMIGEHHDGEVIARVVAGLGFTTARGSSTRGGVRAMREMLRAGREARGLVVTPDGPRGPAHSVAPGVVYLAAATGRPIIPGAAAAERVWRARSWDRMVFPRPFTRLVAVYGDDLEVPRAALEDEALIDAKRDELARLLEQCQVRAQAELASWIENG